MKKSRDYPFNNILNVNYIKAVRVIRPEKKINTIYIITERDIKQQNSSSYKKENVSQMH